MCSIKQENVMLKNQLAHLQNEKFSLPKSQLARLKWCGSRASGRHILQISQTPGILSLINEDPELDVVNVFHSNHHAIIIDHPAIKFCQSSFWTGNLVNTIPFPTDYFNAIVIEDTMFEAFPTNSDSDVPRVLKPNGKVIVSVKLEEAIELKDHWKKLLTHFQEIDKRVDEHYVCWVGRNSQKDSENTEQSTAENLFKDMMNAFNKKNIEKSIRLEESLQHKKDQELDFLEENKKLAMTIPFMKKKQLARIDHLQLSVEEENHILQETEEFKIQTKIISNEERLSQFLDGRKVSIVLGDGDYYRQKSLNFAHRLTDTLMSKGMNVVYICKDENNGIRPTKNGVKNPIQLTYNEFEELTHIFNEPLLFLTSPSLSLAKRVGRFQWKKWSIFYFPDDLNEEDEEVHMFLMNTLHSENFHAHMGSKFPILTPEKNSFVEGSTRFDSSRLTIGFIGNLGEEKVDYRAIKEMLVANQGLVVELIGYNVPKTKPIRSKRLLIREYTQCEEVEKRIDRWAGTVLPVRHPNEMSVYPLLSIDVPLIDVKNWSAPIQEHEVFSLKTIEKLSEVLDDYLPADYKAVH